MKVVADAGPVIHLSWIGQLYLLRELFQTVFMTPVVTSEVLAARPTTPGLSDIYSALAEGYLQRLPPAEPSVIPEARLKALDPGEAEALQAALDIKSDLFLSDDADARRAARDLGLKVAGTLGILRAARRRGLISAAIPLVLALREQGQWLSDALLREIEEEER